MNDVEQRDDEAEVNRTLYLSGLPHETTEDILKELFIQAGPLEKVAIPSNKNNSSAFVTFKHSVSVPYAKVLFEDTQLYGKSFTIGYRHGSIFDERKKQSTQGQYSNNHNQAANYNKYGNYQNPTTDYHGYSGRQYQPSHHSAQRPGQDNRYSPYSRSSRSSIDQSEENRYVPRNPFSANSSIQGYRSSATNREYVPTYISVDNPPDHFMGPAAINRPGHDIDLEYRRQRLLQQQTYVHQADHQRNRHRNENRRR